jgi:hypothetical protein
MNHDKKKLKKVQYNLRNRFEEFILSNDVKNILLTYGNDNNKILIAIITLFKRYANDEIIELREFHKKKLIKKIDNGEYDDGISEIKHIKNIIGDLLLQRENNDTI